MAITEMMLLIYILSSIKNLKYFIGQGSSNTGHLVSTAPTYHIPLPV